MRTLTECRSAIDEAKGRFKSLRRDQQENNSNIKAYRRLKEGIEEAQALIQQTAKETQEQLRYHVEDLVQSAIDTCFPGQYDFFLSFEIKRGRTEAEIYLEREGERINPMDSSGGGVVDIVAFALRLACWSLSRTDPVIVLDEPFKFLSADIRPLAGEILKTLSEKLGLQIIMVTHDSVMIDVSDRVFEVKLKKGKSEIVRL